MLFRIEDYRESSKPVDAADDADVMKMLGELRERRDRLDDAILALSRLVPGAGARSRPRSKKPV